MSNFSKASSPRCRSRSPVFPQDSFHTNKPRNGIRYSVDPKYSYPPFNKNSTTNITLVNLLRKVPTKAISKERWYSKILRFFRIKKLNMYEKSLRIQKSKAGKDASQIFPKVEKLENLGIQLSNGEMNKRKNFLLVVYMVKKFIQIIKTYTFVKRIFHLKAYHFNIIGDISSFYQRGSEFGEKFFGNVTNRTSQNYVRNKIYIYNIHSTLIF